MLRYATETYYQNKIERLEAALAKKEAKIEALKAKLSDLTNSPVDNDD
jgi:SMC interacting uncharacterized protein involved in chromosome segregation